MTSTTFVNKQTVIQADWLNDVNGNTYVGAPVPVGSFREALAAPSGASLAGYLPASAGAVPTNVQAKLRETISTTSYSTLAAALTAADGCELIVNSAVTTNTLTVPTTVSIDVQKGGSISVNAGQTLTLNGPFDAGYFQAFSGAGAVSFGPGSTADVIAMWFGSTGAAIQKAINASALHIKSVYIPAGLWLAAEKIQFPINSPASDGIRVRGCKPENAYSYDYPLSFATVIQATALMDSVFSGRGDLIATVPPETYQITKMHHYGNLENMLILGNSLADYCYINGAQDTAKAVTFAGAKKSGVYLGTFTNSSSFNQVLCVGNAENGAVLDGEYSTVSTWTECKFRGNGAVGMFLYASIGAAFSDCIFENNASAGLQMYRPVNTPQDQILNLKFDNCYFEQNNVTTGGGYQIIINGAAGASPQNIIFDKPHINSGTAGRLGVSVLQGDNILFKDPLITGDNVTLPNWFNIGGNATNVRVSGITEYQSTYFGFGGTGLDNLFIDGYKSTGAKGTFFSRPVKASIINRQVLAPTARTLTVDEVCGTVVTNNGQAASIYIDLPYPVEGYSFTACVTTATGAFYWALRAGANKIIYQGAAKSEIYVSPITLGASLRFIALDGVWLVENIFGTWTTA